MLIDKDRVCVGDIYKKVGEKNILVRENAVLIKIEDYYVPLSKISASSDLKRLDLGLPMTDNESRHPKYKLERTPTIFNNFYVVCVKSKFRDSGFTNLTTLKMMEYSEYGSEIELD